MNASRQWILAGAVVALLVASQVGAEPLSTALTYQGRLQQAGEPVNESADFQFTLWDAAADGAQVGTQVQVNAVTIADGLVNVEVDFGSSVFDGNAVWMQIAVRLPADPGDTEPFTPMSPRQAVTSAPYALQTRGLFVDEAGGVTVGDGVNPAGVSIINGGLCVDVDGNCDSDPGEIKVGPVGINGTGSAGNHVIMVENTGRVGIGTADPSGKLHVFRVDTQTTLDVESTVSYAQLQITSDSGGPVQLRVPTGTDDLRIRTDGQDRMTIRVGGRVGIGTTSPDDLLHIKETDGSTSINVESTTGFAGLKLISAAGGFAEIRAKSATQDLSFRTNDLERMTITDAGKVGIGTTTPTDELHVFRAGSKSIIHAESNTHFAELKLTSSGGTFGSVYMPTDSNDMRLHTGGADRMTIEEGGNVGIGTTAPSNKLTVSGDANFTGNVGIGTATPAADLHVYRSSGQANFLVESSGNLAEVKLLSSGGQFSDIYMSANSNDLKLWTGGDSGAVRMIITEGGNVGIGTTSPIAKLHVNGTTRTEILEITGGGDIAEPFDVCGDQPVVAGMVVAIDPDRTGSLRIANHPYDPTVAGIISGAGGVNPGMTLRQEGTEADGEHPVALTGRVWCLCDADANGPIQPGDLLTSSATPGHAMKATDREMAFGSTVGKAMSSLDSGRGLVLVLVTLQ